MNNLQKPTIDSKSLRCNEDLLCVLEQLKNIMVNRREPFRARAYSKAYDTLVNFSEDIIYPKDQLKGLPGIGDTILNKLDEYVTNGTLPILEEERNNPINLFVKIYGVGPKKAQQLVDHGITTIQQLKEHADLSSLLNDKQLIGLKYYDDINQRIPRSEIDNFNGLLQTVFVEIAEDRGGDTSSTFIIVGSYSRGSNTSGDIDILITNSNNNREIYDLVINKLIERKVIIEVLSRGNIKCLTIANTGAKFARRVDFMYSPPGEYAFALLYFTGSKIFNTVLRQRALDLRYTLNEHGICYIDCVKGTKSNKVEQHFASEKSIFDFLGVKYKTPHERNNAQSLELKNEKIEKKDAVVSTHMHNHNKTFKNKTKLMTSSIVQQHIDKFKSEGITAIKMLTPKELSDVISTVNDSYYENNISMLTDHEYDILISYAKTINVVTDGHAECSLEHKKNKVELPYQLWSMDKMKASTCAVQKWTGSYTGPYVVSCKLDGVSGLYTIQNGVQKLYTRGNGRIGQDISHMIPALRLPLKLSGGGSNIAIRGEFIIAKKVFEEKYGAKFANPRNFVAGVINHKTVAVDKCKDIDFVAYEVIEPTLAPAEQMRFLGEGSWCANYGASVKYTVVDSGKLTNEYLSEMLLLWRDENKYEIDGVIVVNNKIYPRPKQNPEYAFAFKMVISDQVAEAHVLDVIWSPSKHGYLKPRIQIVPITLGGVTIEYATGFNGKFIVDNKVGFGAVVRIIRSGDVIPHIEAVIVPAEKTSLPLEPCKWNETNVDLVLVNLEDDVVVREKNITGFFKGIDVAGLGAGNINRIIAAGYDTVPKIIAMKTEDFMKVDGFKNKMATKVYTGIQTKIKEVPLVEIMAASNIFGRGFGVRRFRAILNAYPNILDIYSIPDKKKVDLIAGIDGFATKTAERFVNGLPEFIEFMKTADISYKLDEHKGEHKDEQAITESGVGVGVGVGEVVGEVVLSGFRDNKLSEKLKTIGGTVGESVTKATKILIVKNKGGTTSKIQTAEKFSIPIMTMEEFTGQYLQ